MMARQLAAAFAVAMALITLIPADGSRRLKRRRNAATPRQRAEFLRKMRAGVAPREHRLREERFMEHVMSRAVPTSSFAVPSTTQWTQGFVTDVLMSKTPSFRRRLEDGGAGDDDAAGDDVAADDAVDDDQYGQFGFDVTAYSLKYIGCSSVRTYSDEMAEGGDVDTVLLTMRFVIFRLCPTDYCSANSKYGCSNGYGEYLLQMEDYLEGMAEFNERKLQNFCEYCDRCINGEEEEAEGDDARRRLDDAGDDAVGDDAAGANNDCEDYDFCYANIYICEEEEHDDDAYVEPIDYSEFFECREVDNANGNNNNNNNNGYYVGPHCGSDGHTITVGLYSDEFCSEYVGAEVDIVEYTGMDFDDDALAEYHPDDCISCKESDLPYQRQDENEDGDGDDGDDVMELCERMYEESGKCNRYIGDADEDSYESYQQGDNEQLVCNYIKNLITGSYDEDGYIRLDEGDGVVTQITSTIEEISIGQIFGLIFTVLGCVVMLVWACILHRAIIKNNAENAALVAAGGGGNGPYGEMSRQNSGIVMGRSRSGGSYTGAEGTFA